MPDVQRLIHYVVSQAESLHMPPLDVEMIKQQLYTRLMAPPSAYAGLEGAAGSYGSSSSQQHNASSASTLDLAEIAARRVSAEAAMSASGRAQAEEECQAVCESVLEKLTSHRRATLRTIAATRAYDQAWINLVPALRRFEVGLPLQDVHTAEGRMAITEHISRCVVAMRALAVWQANAVNLVEAVVLWRSALNRPFPFALDGHCNVILRLALDAAAIRSSPIPPPLLVGGAGVSLDHVVFPTFLSHLPSLCEFALSGGGGGGGSTNSNVNELFGGLASAAPAGGGGGGGGGGDADNQSVVSTSTEDALVLSLARRWERRALAMHFASKHDEAAWAIEAAEDVVASFAGLPGRRGPQQEVFNKRVRAAEFTVGCEHNTHWQLMRELLSFASDARHVPLLHLPELINPNGGEDGVLVECPELLDGLLRTLTNAIEALHAITRLPDDQDDEDDGEGGGGGGDEHDGDEQE